jgi:hypothetical protein
MGRRDGQGRCAAAGADRRAIGYRVAARPPPSSAGPTMLATPAHGRPRP